MTLLYENILLDPLCNILNGITQCPLIELITNMNYEKGKHICK